MECTAFFCFSAFLPTSLLYDTVLDKKIVLLKSCNACAARLPCSISWEKSFIRDRPAVCSASCQTCLLVRWSLPYMFVQTAQDRVFQAKDEPVKDPIARRSAASYAGKCMIWTIQNAPLESMTTTHAACFFSAAV